MIVEFNEQQIKLLLEFLSRVDIKGFESQNHAILVQTINRPKQSQDMTNVDSAAMLTELKKRNFDFSSVNGILDSVGNDKLINALRDRGISVNDFSKSELLEALKRKDINTNVIDQLQ